MERIMRRNPARNRKAVKEKAEKKEINVA